jgi:hypothetical protein
MPDDLSSPFYIKSEYGGRGREGAGGGSRGERRMTSEAGRSKALGRRKGCASLPSDNRAVSSRLFRTESRSTSLSFSNFFLIFCSFVRKIGAGGLALFLCSVVK